MEQTDRAYLSVLSWPERFTHFDRVEALVRAAGMDPYDAGQMARRATPKIVQMFDAAMRDDVLGVLHAAGVLALAPTRAEMAAYPRPESPAAVTRPDAGTPSAFTVHTRAGEPWTFRPDDVRLVVAGKVRTVGRTRRHADASDPGFVVDESRGFLANVVDLGVQLDAALDEPAGWGSNTTRNARAVETIDLHIVTGGVTGGRMRVVRLSGLSSRVRPESERERRPSLIEAHRPVDDLRAWLPDAVFDEWFPNFNTPGDIEALAARAGQASSRLNPVAFDFYSVWVAQLDRTVRGW